MKKAIAIVNSWWFRSALAAAAGVALLLKKEIFYSGVAFGIAAREILLAFKKEDKANCGCNCSCCKNCENCQMLKS